MVIIATTAGKSTLSRSKQPSWQPMERWTFAIACISITVEREGEVVLRNETGGISATKCDSRRQAQNLSGSMAKRLSTALTTGM